MEDLEYDLVPISEFDALNIELKESSEALLTSKYPAKEHAKKVAEELGVSKGIIYLPGQVEATWEDSDMGPPFRQRRYFYYLTGVDFPGCAVTYDISADKLILWARYTDPRLALWYGKTPSPAEYMDQSDLDDATYISELGKYLRRKLAQIKSLYVLHDSQLPKFGCFHELKPHIKIDTSSLQAAIDEARVVKSAYEIAMIRKACEVSSTAHKAVCESLLALKNECEIEAAFSAACLSQNAHSQSYPIIAGSGANASTLHYDANDEPLEGRQLVVLDAGAEWKTYASDITRTLPIPGRFTKEGKAIYDLVAGMQEQCIDLIRPGTPFHCLHLHAHLVAIKGLMRLGILHNGHPGEIMKAGTSTAFFPHGLGHHVGLEVHDVAGKQRLMYGNADASVRMGKRAMYRPEDLKAELSEYYAHCNAPTQGRLLEPGMIVTVEPGIYFHREYIEAFFLNRPEHARYINTGVLEKYWDVGGVRIEDCVLVIKDGHEVLSTAPKGDEMLKIINGQ